MSTAEHARLAESPRDTDPWRHWGPYVSGRQWGTVREDYSADGDAWASFSFDQSHQRAYRWGEDGIAGLCDRFGFLNLAVALWNRHDDRLKERMFGLTNQQGNHGEDVKEYWYHLDATPTHSFAQMLYRYPQAAFPYQQLIDENARRHRNDPEYELSDTGVLDEDRFFDVQVTHAKAGPSDICIEIRATNHGPDAAPLDILPTLWFRNTWAWGLDDRRPSIHQIPSADLDAADTATVHADHGHLGAYRLVAEGSPRVLFCDNESNAEALWGTPNLSPHPKDAIGRAVVQGDGSALNPAQTGTKCAFHYSFDAIGPGETVLVRLRLTAPDAVAPPFGGGFDDVVDSRRAEADEFYAEVIPAGTHPDDAHVARRAFAGLLWGKQLYRYDVRRWLDGDPVGPPPPSDRRNENWHHLYLADVMSMPDEWEYPWFAAWDLAFHCVTLAHVDPAFAKNQLILLCREWAQHPDGKLPAYEWRFDDAAPPVHAWAAWRVFVLDGGWDRGFLVRVFGKLLLNFTWWVNSKDPDGSNLFEGGFLGMDNIGPFDRSSGVPDGWRLEQSDATSWMAFLCLGLLQIALELARKDDAWDDLATTFLERFVAISRAVTDFGRARTNLWDDQDGFFYDTLVSLADGQSEQLRVRSLVGLLPLLAVASVPGWVPDEVPRFTERLEWLRRDLGDAAGSVLHQTDGKAALTLGLVRREWYPRILDRLLDEHEFLSVGGIRSLSAVYAEGETIEVAGAKVEIGYNPGESKSGMFGGNSNWRGPVWFPINVLIADALKIYAAGAGADLTVPFPTGSGDDLGLRDVARALDDRLVGLFRPNADGRRLSDPRDKPAGPLWDSHPVFSEYFHGDTGAGLGASHQTGWTALVAHLICAPTDGERLGG